jgi:hypothetical protein
MATQQEICCFCGEPILFRVIHGVTTPIHTGPARCVGRRLYRRDQEGVPHNTQCPRCRKAVIFLRHNGGCVWLDALGWPWPKHPCFDNDPSTRSIDTMLHPSAVALKGGCLLFAGYIGTLASHQGIAILLCSEKKELRRLPKYSCGSQWEIPCHHNAIGHLAQVFTEVRVVASAYESCLIMPDGTRFDMRAHNPVYLGRAT